MGNGNSSSNYPAAAVVNPSDIENPGPAGGAANEQEHPLIADHGDGGDAGGGHALAVVGHSGGDVQPGNGPAPPPDDEDDEDDDGGVYFGRHFLLGGRADRVGVEHAALRGDLASLLLQGGPMVRLPPLRAAPAVSCRALLRRQSLRLVPASEPDSYALELRYDASCECQLRVWFGPAQDPALNEGVTASAGTTELVLPPAMDGQALVPARDWAWFQPGDWTEPRFPLVLQLSVRGAAASSGVDTQTCYARLSRGDQPEAPLTCRVAAVKIRHRGHTYLLHEIFGGEADAPEPTPVTAPPVHPASADSNTPAPASASPGASPGASPSASTAKGQVVEMRGRECVICMTEPRDTTVLPCRHMCVCSGCAEAMRSQTHKCPICRAHVKSLVQIRSPLTPLDVEPLPRK